MLDATVSHTARQFARAIVMPNLVKPITTSQLAEQYRARIMAAIPSGVSFEPLMTIYLTDHSDPDDIETGYMLGHVKACKLYPAHATTNAAYGVARVRSIYPVLERMQKIGMPLLIHGEVTDPDVDVFDREAVFIERVLTLIVRDWPELKIVLEHITTSEAVGYVMDAPAMLAATITPHHLQMNRNAMFDGGLRPHHYCLPVIKRERHRRSLRKAAISGSPRFFLGTDSAPHPRDQKESACACAGIFNAPVAMESYATVFDEEGSLNMLEAFASENGPRFYGLPLNNRRIVLRHQETKVPDELQVGGVSLVPYHAGFSLKWRFVEVTD